MSNPTGSYGDGTYGGQSKDTQDGRLAGAIVTAVIGAIVGLFMLAIAVPLIYRLFIWLWP